MEYLRRTYLKVKRLWNRQRFVVRIILFKNNFHAHTSIPLFHENLNYYTKILTISAWFQISMECGKHNVWSSSWLTLMDILPRISKMQRIIR